MDVRKPTVIIVGGGPVGLMTALGLTRANIDFILLEQRRSVVVDEGSDMTLQPMIMRALDQMGLLKPLSKIWNPVFQIERIDHSGRPMGELRFFQYIRKSTGYYPSVLSRRELLQTFYAALPEKSHDKILTNKKVAGIRETSDGITVSCTDGTTYDGAFVIGADGAFSAARECMRKLALDAESPGDANKAEPFVISYQALWIRFPTVRVPGCKPGTAIETHGSGIATQLFAGVETATVGVYRRLPKPTTRSSRYSEKDQIALIDEWGHLPLVREGNFCLRDAFDERLGSGLLSLEEGILPKWSWNGRVVLVGDAAHKFTPSTGSGLNHGLVDVVALMNAIHGASKAGGGDGTKPWWNKSSLAVAFETYQQARLQDVTNGCRQASGATAMATWTNLSLRLFDQYVMPNPIVQWLLGVRIASNAKAAKPLSFDFE